MKISFLSDIHGNLPALELALEKSGKVDGYIILGDVVNYGPWSNECVKLIETLPNCTKILGNHELFFLQGKCDIENSLAKKFFNHCYPKFEEVSLIQNYVEELKFENFTCVHTIEDKYIYKDTDVTLGGNFIIGHSHQQYKIIQNDFYCNCPYLHV